LCKLKSEFFGESFQISFKGLIEYTGCNAIGSSEVTIDDNRQLSDCIDGELIENPCFFEFGYTASENIEFSPYPYTVIH